MKRKQSILKKIVPFLILVMALIFASSASVAEARSRNPHRDGAHDRRVAHDHSHSDENTDRDGSSHSDEEGDTNHDGDHDNHDDMDDDTDDDETPTHEPTAEIFSAALSPENETTPPVLDNADSNEGSDDESGSDTDTMEDALPEGVATFKLVTREVYDEETDSRVEVQELYYRLLVRDIDDVTAAHIHMGQPGEDGDIVAPLYSGDPMGEFNGQLSEGIITEADLTGPLTGDMDGLVTLLESGGLYVNVHTVVNPAGEIRGQITQ